MTGAVLNLSDVAFDWAGRFSLRVVDLRVAKGESVLLLGESGSGKSTLLSLICGTIVPDSGRIEIAGQDITELSASKRDKFRAEQIGVIFQQFNLLPFGTVADNIMLPLRFAPARNKQAGDALAKATELCRALGLPDGVTNIKATALSVGQQQRVAVARALIGRPPLIIADEPTSALDANSQAAFLDLLFAQVHSNETSLLMVSHDPRLGARFDRVIDMQDIAHVERGAA
ncbi:ABC transporter ATP-binding protein [Planktotalea sp.]|jgi:putative ABC transport system ATP-binding protein|uniref:ABC transporter ATP-binding protein n=1 Tax=Planktotalea sp. TaxID=2029877 RepID=UPI003F6D2900